MLEKSFVLASVRVGQVKCSYKPPKKNKGYSFFCNFVPLCEWTLKGQSLENKQSCIFPGMGNILLQKVQSMSKHKPQSLEVKFRLK